MRVRSRPTNLLGLEALAAGTATQVANHLIATTETLTTTASAEVLLDKGMLGVNVATKIVLAFEVELAAGVLAGEGEEISVNRHVRLELRPGGEWLSAGRAGVRLDWASCLCGGGGRSRAVDGGGCGGGRADGGDRGGAIATRCCGLVGGDGGGGGGRGAAVVGLGLLVGGGCRHNRGQRLSVLAVVRVRVREEGGRRSHVGFDRGQVQGHTHLLLKLLLLVVMVVMLLCDHGGIRVVVVQNRHCGGRNQGRGIAVGRCGGRSRTRGRRAIRLLVGLAVLLVAVVLIILVLVELLKHVKRLLVEDDGGNGRRRRGGHLSHELVVEGRASGLCEGGHGWREGGDAH